MEIEQLQSGSTIKQNQIAEALITPTYKQVQKRFRFIGVVLMITFAFFTSLSESISKIIYIRNPQLGFLEFIFMKAILAVLFMWFLVFRREKNILYTSIPKHLVKPLALRILLGFLVFGLVFYSMKYTPIIIVALFLNMTPLFTSALAYLILRERITVIEVVCLLLAFFGVYQLIAADLAESQQDITLVPLVLLVLVPVFNGLINVLLRKMKELHEYTSPSYLFATTMVLSGFALFIFEREMTFFQSKSLYDYLLLVFSSILGCASMVIKTKAFQYETASRLSIFYYLIAIFTLCFDFIFIGSELSNREIVAVVIIFISNALSAFIMFKRSYG